MKGILKAGLVTVLVGVVLGIVFWGLGFTPSSPPAVWGQGQYRIYFPLVMKNYEGLTGVQIESDRAVCSSLTVVGELKNYEDTYYTPSLTGAKLYDSGGVFMTEAEGCYSSAYSLAPGDVTAFWCFFFCLPTREWSYYTVDFSPYEAYARPLNLVVSGVTLQESVRRLLV